MHVPNVDFIYITVGFIFYMLFVQVLENDIDVLVTTTGPLKGRQVYDDVIRVYYRSYEGIPYAEKPIGSLRFKDPRPIELWNETLIAINQRALCMQPQKFYSKDEMSEDCLYLNIYAPYDKTDEDFKAVYVYLNSDIWPLRSGDSETVMGPQLFLNQNIVFVSVNYRLGPFGFLSLDIEDASGNAGLKDIKLALKWVKANIKKFGGDSSKITLGGSGSGAAMVQYLMQTKINEGLFQNAVIISGSVLNYNNPSKNLKDAMNLAQELGIENYDKNVVLKKLQNVNAFDIVKIYEKTLTYSIGQALRWPVQFQPSIEIDSENSMFTKNSINALKSGPAFAVNTLIGFSDQEAYTYLPINNKNLKDINNNIELIIPSNILYTYGSEKSKTLATSIMKLYFDSKPLSKENIQNLTNLIADTQFIYPINKWVKLFNTKKSSKKLYYYNFAFDGDLNFAKKSKEIPLKGAIHGDINGYMYVSSKLIPFIKTANELSRNMQNTISTLFSNFMKYGNPTPPAQTKDIKWLDYGKNGNFLYLADKQEVRSQFSEDLVKRLTFWDQVYDEYDKHVSSGKVK